MQRKTQRKRPQTRVEFRVRLCIRQIHNCRISNGPKFFGSAHAEAKAKAKANAKSRIKLS